MQHLGSRTRANLRRSMRQLNQPTGFWAETADQAEEMLHRMIERHQARWNAVGMPGSYASRRFREFHFDLVHRLVPLGAMGMFRVTCPDGILGCAQVFIDNNRALLYQSGWSPREGDSSPGLIVDYLCMAACCERGFDHFDFMAGESEYKRRLSTNTTDLAWVVWRQPRLKHAVLDSLRTIKQLLKRLDSSSSSGSAPEDPAADPSPKKQ